MYLIVARSSDLSLSWRRERLPYTVLLADDPAASSTLKNNIQDLHELRYPQHPL
jgi:hypothetical protein